jgi:hypothetical protein
LPPVHITPAVESIESKSSSGPIEKFVPSNAPSLVSRGIVAEGSISIARKVNKDESYREYPKT